MHSLSVSDHYTHTMAIRADTGKLLSTSLAQVTPDGLVLDLSGHFERGRGTLLFHEVYARVQAAEARLGNTVELVHDAGLLHAQRLRSDLAPVSPR